MVASQEVTARPPIRHRRQRPIANLTSYLAAHAGPLPPALRTRPGVDQIANRVRDRAVSGVSPQALAEMRRIWGVAGRYFPGRGMPVPGGHPVGGEALGAVGFARNPKNQP